MSNGRYNKGYNISKIVNKVHVWIVLSTYSEWLHPFFGQVQCCPVNPSLITVIGVGFARTFRATDSALRPVSTGVGKRENQTFLCHIWLTDRSDSDSDNDLSDKDSSDKDGACIYALSSGELLYVGGGEVGAFLTLISSTCSTPIDLICCTLYPKILNNLLI